MICCVDVMVASKNSPPGLLPPRAQFIGGDLKRNSDLYDLPMLRMPPNLFKASQKSPRCSMLLIAAQLPEFKLSIDDQLALAESLTRNIHLNKKFRNAKNELIIGDASPEGEKVFDALMMDALLTSGVPTITEAFAAKLLKRSKQDRFVAALEATTKEAVERGTYGSPTMFIEDQSQSVPQFIVFGSDRFEQIAHICNKPYYGVNMQLKGEL